jgi:hypothetical protein
MMMLTRRHRSQSRRTHEGRGRRKPIRRVIPTAPEDAALYVCGCGNAFTAAVTTGVTCPSCGHGQAW